MRKSNFMKKRIFLALSGILAVCSMASCGISGEQVKEEVASGLFSSMAKDELFRVGDVSCSVSEYMVYLTNTQNQYEKVYGSEIWDVALGEITLEENVKDTVLAKIAQIKTMSLMAEENGIVLSEEEVGKAEAAASEYFGSLSEQEITALAVARETIAKLYKEYALANKIYQQIVDGVDPEISDEEARTITVD